MTPTQAYGRTQGLVDDPETPPEDWQFENSTPVKITGRKPVEVPKLNLAAFVPEKEDDTVKFLELTMDKQIRLVADEYNKGARPIDIQRKLGIKGAGTYYDRLEKAKAMGLVTDDTDNSPGVEARYIPKAIHKEANAAPRAEVDDFAHAAQVKLELAEKLAKEAECLQQAGTIALALEELLGDKSGRVIAALYAEVSV